MIFSSERVELAGWALWLRRLALSLFLAGLILIPFASSLGLLFAAAALGQLSQLRQQPSGLLLIAGLIALVVGLSWPEPLGIIAQLIAWAIIIVSFLRVLVLADYRADARRPESGSAVESGNIFQWRSLAGRLGTGFQPLFVRIESIERDQVRVRTFRLQISADRQTSAWVQEATLLPLVFLESTLFRPLALPLAPSPAALAEPPDPGPEIRATLERAVSNDHRRSVRWRIILPAILVGLLAAAINAAGTLINQAGLDPATIIGSSLFSTLLFALVSSLLERRRFRSEAALIASAADELATNLFEENQPVTRGSC